MRSLYEAKAIQVEITNYCSMQCPNCTRFIGHQPKSYFMSLDGIEEALQSLVGFKNKVGCMGGEPTLHPEFKEVCELYQMYLPKEKRGLWTNGFNWDKYEDIIRKTFPIKNIVYNDHSFKYLGYHQPLLIASKDIIKDEILRKRLIDNCWIQKRWSGSINPNGAFFCEVAAAMDLLFDLKGGWKVERDWWRKKPEDFQDQVDLYCGLCSAAIPFSKEVYKSKLEYASPSILELRGFKRFVIFYNKEYTLEDYKENVKDWKPGQFRNFYQCEPNKRLTKEEYNNL